MLRVASETIYLGLSKENKLLRVELLNVMDYEGGWYVVYWEDMFDFNNEHCDNLVMINEQTGIRVNSLSSKFGYKIFDSKRDAVEFIYNNEEFKVLK